MTHILYKDLKTYIFDDNTYCYPYHLIYVLDHILHYNYQTFQGYMKAFKSIHKNRYLIPIKLSDTILLMPMFGYRSVDNLLINYHEVATLKRDQFTTIITFKNKVSINVFKPYALVMKQWKQCFHLIENKKTFSYKENSML